jgi:hypothetical protein
MTLTNPISTDARTMIKARQKKRKKSVDVIYPTVVVFDVGVKLPNKRQ